MRAYVGSIRGFLCLVVLGAVPLPALAQEGAAADESTRPWTNETQLALVDSAGNSTSRTIAISERFTYNWTYAELVLGAELFRASSTRRVLTLEDGTVAEDLVETITAARYEATGKYRHNVFEEMFWYALGSWYRNRPAGIDSRQGLGGGVGYRFLENASSLLAGEAGIGVERETPVGMPTDTFAVARGYLELRHKFSDAGSFAAEAELLGNLQDTRDLRVNGRASVTSKLTDMFALRIGLDLRYDNQPGIVTVDGGPGVPVGFFVLDKLDRTLGASLVVSF